MAWEQRGSERKYFYRSVRDANGRVQKQYFGRGPDAELAAELHMLRRAERQLEAEKVKHQQQRIDHVVTPLDQFSAELETLLHAALLASGFHFQKSEWRRKRAKT